MQKDFDSKIITESLTYPINLSIVAPAYNESQSIVPVLQEWHHFLADNSGIQKFEIVICNDGSTDNTGFLLNDFAKKHPEVRPLHLEINQGAAAALAFAISESQYQWVLLTDSDGQFPIQNLSILLNALKIKPALCALGVRCKKDTIFFRFGTKASGFVCNLVHGSKIKDFNSAFKLVYGLLLRSLILEAKGANYSTEITSRLLERKIDFIEVNIEHKHRVSGKSSMNLIRGSFHRLLFVSYIALRQLLLKLGVLRRT